MDTEPTTTHQRKKDLGKTLNKWKQEFASLTGKAPTKTDLMADDAIRDVYLEYQQLTQASVYEDEQPPHDAEPAREAPDVVKQDEPSGPGDDAAKRRHDLGKQLNAWKTQYTEEHGKPPTKKVMLQDETIRDRFLEYQELSALVKKDGASTVAPSEAPTEEATPQPVHPDPASQLAVPASAAKSRKKQLSKQLNEWKKQYAEEHGKNPTKSVLMESDIRDVYLEYQELQGGSRDASPARPEDADAPTTTPKPEPVSDGPPPLSAEEEEARMAAESAAAARAQEAEYEAQAQREKEQAEREAAERKRIEDEAAAREAAVWEEAARKEAARKEAEREEAARAEAAREEAARAEAARAAAEAEAKAAAEAAEKEAAEQAAAAAAAAARAEADRVAKEAAERRAREEAARQHERELKARQAAEQAEAERLAREVLEEQARAEAEAKAAAAREASAPLPDHAGSPDQKARKTELSKQLNKWKKEYTAEYGKPPTKTVLLNDDAIRDVFLEYQALASGGDAASPAPSQQLAGDESPTSPAPGEQSDMESPVDRKKFLAKQLNVFKSQYNEDHGNPPVKGDILRDPNAREMFIEYMALSGKPVSDAELAAHPVEGEAPPPPTLHVEGVSPDARRHEVGKQLNAWKAQYTEEHGKPPTKKVMLQDDDIRELFLEYQQLSERGESHSVAPTDESHLDTSADSPKSRKKHLAKLLNDWKKQYADEHGKNPTKTVLMASDIRDVFIEYQELQSAGSRDVSPSRADEETPSRADESNRKAELAKVLNSWKRGFSDVHGHPPKKADLLADDGIRDVFLEYQELMGGATTPSPSKAHTEGDAGSPDRKKVLAKQLNVFKSQYTETHGKPPVKGDILRDADAREMFIEYMALNGKPVSDAELAAHPLETHTHAKAAPAVGAAARVLEHVPEAAAADTAAAGDFPTRAQAYQTATLPESMLAELDAEYETMLGPSPTKADTPAAAGEPGEEEEKAVEESSEDEDPKRELQKIRISEHLSTFDKDAGANAQVLSSLPVATVQEAHRARLLGLDIEREDAELLHQAALGTLERIEKKRHDALERESHKKKEDDQVLQRQFDSSKESTTKMMRRFFKQAEVSLSGHLATQRSAILQQAGDWRSYIRGSHDEDRVNWAKLPQQVEICIASIRGMKNKVPKGNYVVLISQWQQIYGTPMRWAPKPLTGAYKPPCALHNTPQKHCEVCTGWVGCTMPVFHEGKSTTVDTTVNSRMFTVFPSKHRIKPYMALMFEVLKLPADGKGTPKAYGWGAFPCVDSKYSIINGRFKLPLLRGTPRKDLDHYSAMEKFLKEDIENWLGNLYMDVFPYPREYYGRGEFELQSIFHNEILNLNRYPSSTSEEGWIMDGRPRGQSLDGNAPTLEDVVSPSHAKPFPYVRADDFPVFDSRGKTLWSLVRESIRSQKTHAQQKKEFRKEQILRADQHRKYRVAVHPPGEVNVKKGWRVQIGYCGRAIMDELSLRQPATTKFWAIIAVALVMLYVQLFYHGVAQYVALRMLSIPVNKLIPRLYGLEIVYSSYYTYALQELWTAYFPMLMNFMAVALLVVAGAVIRLLSGNMPESISKFVFLGGFGTLAVPFVHLFVDLGLNNTDGDIRRLMVFFEHHNYGAQWGVFVFVVLYLFIVVLTVVTIFMFTMRLHLNGVLQDSYRRIMLANEDNFFVPNDLEVSYAELLHVLQKAERWRGKTGERRKVRIHELMTMDENDPEYSRKDLHIAVMHMDCGDLEQWKKYRPMKSFREFFCMSDGSLVESVNRKAPKGVGFVLASLKKNKKEA